MVALLTRMWAGLRVETQPLEGVRDIWLDFIYSHEKNAGLSLLGFSSDVIGEGIEVNALISNN